MKTQNLLLWAAVLAGTYVIYKKVIQPKVLTKEVDAAIKEREQFTNLIAKAEQTPGAQIDNDFSDYETL